MIFIFCFYSQIDVCKVKSKEEDPGLKVCILGLIISHNDHLEDLKLVKVVGGGELVEDLIKWIGGSI
jgi:hypothetical protein